MHLIFASSWLIFRIIKNLFQKFSLPLLRSLCRFLYHQVGSHALVKFCKLFLYILAKNVAFLITPGHVTNILNTLCCLNCLNLQPFGLHCLLPRYTGDEAPFHGINFHLIIQLLLLSQDIHRLSSSCPKLCLLCCRFFLFLLSVLYNAPLKVMGCHIYNIMRLFLINLTPGLPWQLRW